MTSQKIISLFFTILLLLAPIAQADTIKVVNYARGFKNIHSLEKNHSHSLKKIEALVDSLNELIDSVKLQDDLSSESSSSSSENSE